MKLTQNKRSLTALVVCVALGTTGGIAGSMAASSKSGSKTKSSTRAATEQGLRHHRGPGGPGGPGVHSESVVLNKAGDGFITRTDDDGTVKSVSGNTVTITEGVGSVTYKDVEITIPDGATVERNGAAAKVSDLKAGDRIHVSSSSEGTFVFAGDAAHAPGPGRGPHGHGGPPPGAPAP